jgi:hypothetical protein
VLKELHPLMIQLWLPHILKVIAWCPLFQTEFVGGNKSIVSCLLAPCIILCSSLVSFINRVLPFYRLSPSLFLLYLNCWCIHFCCRKNRHLCYPVHFIVQQAWSLIRWWAPFGPVPENLLSVDY